MATQQEIQDNINLIVTGANYPANSMRPLLTSMLDFSSSGQTLVFPDLVADNTTMADTTLVLEYGVNVIITSTCYRLVGVNILIQMYLGHYSHSLTKFC